MSSDRTVTPYEDWQDAWAKLRATTKDYLSAHNMLAFAALRANGFDYPNAPSLEDAAAEYARQRRVRDDLLAITGDGDES